MCGIAGVVDREQSGLAVVRAMTASLARRGPDGEGFTESSEASLGHRRLSIFDLSSAGSQPMFTADGSLGVVFNGAIYNFRPLRAELETKGYVFRSRTDTEVLLHGYREWGIDELLRRLRGMFAFGLWDERSHTLWLVRDRLGVKPLLYAVAGKRIAFASTARALHDAGHGGDIDPAAAWEVLQKGYVSDARSIWQGLHKLGAAHCLEWRDGRIQQIKAYWQPPAAPDSGGPSFDEAVEETERLMLEAVRRRLDADVPVGALLSGGIDSSLVCWAISKLGGDVTAFTIGTPGDVGDESTDAGETARELKIRHHIIAADGLNSPGIEDLVTAYAEPFGCPSAMGMLQVSAAVRREATVLLTGDGGDDVFLGYPEHRACWTAERLARRLPSASEGLLRTAASVLPSWGPARRLRTLLRLATGGVEGWRQAQDRMGYYRQTGILGERLRNLAPPEPPYVASLDNARHLMRDFLVYDQGRFTGEYMTKVDGGAMFHALEARSPFLDQDLWEFAASLPTGLRLRGGQLKAILRALARKRLAPRVAEGRKRGFSIPVQRWIRGERREQVRESFRNSRLAAGGWIDAGAVLRQLDRNDEAPLALWYVYAFECWLKAEAERAR